MQGYSIWLTGNQPRFFQGIAGIVLGAAIAGLPGPVLAQGYDLVPVLPTGAMPLPANALPPTPTPVSGQQYVVLVNGANDQVLNQVRLVEPTAFATNFQGRSVIQAGRFNLADNAQQRVTALMTQGIAAEVATAPAAQPFYPQAAAPANVYASSGALPPLPALPQSSNTLPALPPPAPNVEFGQQLTYAAPANANAYPMNVAPPTAAVLPASTPGSNSAPINAPYYVVIPTGEANLPSLSAQVIQMGTPADRVQQRTAPQGPHVAVGPFADLGLANRWNSFYRDSGLTNARVYFQP
ncbi:MAG: hypothetical protein ACOYMP_07965 [Nodosilinea sp.]